MEFDGSAGFGKDGKLEFWVNGGSEAQRPMHIAFVIAPDGLNVEAVCHKPES
jgi:hypothetical protein